VAGVGFEPT
jgi:hypothetical protein